MENLRQKAHKIAGDIGELLFDIFNFEHFTDMGALELEKLGDWAELDQYMREQLDQNLGGYHIWWALLTFTCFENLVENGEPLSYHQILDQFLEIYQGRWDDLLDRVVAFFNLKITKE